jgi:hypothetical protein
MRPTLEPPWRPDMAHDVRSSPRPGLDLVNCERLWSAAEVSAFLGVPVATLHQWRYRGSGPSAFRVGRHLRYNPESVRLWLEQSCSGGD